MKKAVLIAILAAASAALFADVSVKLLDNGKAEVTFLYPDTGAKSVLVAGDFTNWQSGAKTMKKTDAGFVYTRVVAKNTVMEYKFIVDKNWTADKNAPAKKDDGFGGKNGLVDVASLLDK
ncbi:MAG: glycogen-binding domain-containing protein [Treponema sp.]|nr:glycogen-binding domain-containing protein [Treponema sp.]